RRRHEHPVTWLEPGDLELSDGDGPAHGHRRRLLEGDVVRDAAQDLGGHRHEIRIGTLAMHADQLRLRAGVVPTDRARVAESAGDEWNSGHVVTGRELDVIGAHLHDLAREVRAEDVWKVDAREGIAARPGAHVEEAAHADGTHSDDRLLRTGPRLRDVLDPE